MENITLSSNTPGELNTLVSWLRETATLRRAAGPRDGLRFLRADFASAHGGAPAGQTCLFGIRCPAAHRRGVPTLAVPWVALLFLLILNFLYLWPRGEASGDEPA